MTRYETKGRKFKIVKQTKSYTTATITRSYHRYVVLKENGKRAFPRNQGTYLTIPQAVFHLRIHIKAKTTGMSFEKALVKICTDRARAARKQNNQE